MEIQTFNSRKDDFKKIGPEMVHSFCFSICTLVTDFLEYKKMRLSFKQKGFTDDDCEFLCADNASENRFEAFSGINRFLQESQGEYIILCHQDIILEFDDREMLERRLGELDAIDDKWAICSNAGGVSPNHLTYKVSYSSTETEVKGSFPSRVFSVDENFIVLKRSANLALSSNLAGFHLYGTDLCLIADILGYTSYVIDFNIIHLSKGNVNQDFYSISKNLRKKYTKALRGRFMQTTITRFYISGSRINNIIFNTIFAMFFSRMFNGLKKRMITNNDGGKRFL